VQNFLHSLSRRKIWTKKIHRSSVTAQGSGEVESSWNFEDSEEIDFQKQLDKIALWFERWSHSQVSKECKHDIIFFFFLLDFCFIFNFIYA